MLTNTSWTLHLSYCMWLHFFTFSSYLERETKHHKQLFRFCNITLNMLKSAYVIWFCLWPVIVTALTFDLCLLESHVTHTAITPAVVYLLCMCFPAQGKLCFQWPTSRGYLLGWISENFIFLSALNIVMSLTPQTFPYLTKVAKVAHIHFTGKSIENWRAEKHLILSHDEHDGQKHWSSFPGSFSVSDFLSLLHWLKTHEGKWEYRHECLCRVILLVCDTLW